MKYHLYIDGAARGNPGPAGAGACLMDEQGKIVESLTKYLGKTTNNIAEYEALLLGLNKAKKKKIKDIHIFSDSELLVRQIQGRYRVLNPNLKKKYDAVMNIVKTFHHFTISHIRRDKNKIADQLANQAIDDINI